MELIQGQTVRLYDRQEIGKDAFNATIYDDIAVDVENVLICPVSTQDIVADMQLYGKKAEYELHIPKADEHTWENRIVEFYGNKWKTYGIPLKWMGELTPGAWNQKVRVERYG